MKHDLELFLVDGTRLADMSDEALDELKRSFGKYMAVLGRTTHFQRKNKANLDLYRDDMARIETELERRRSLNTVNLGGWQGYIQSVLPPRILWLWEAVSYKGEYADDAIPLLKVDGKLHRCPSDREPTHYALYDELYTLKMDHFSEWMKEGSRYRQTETVCIPGRIFKRLVHNAGFQKEMEDPLAVAPWTVLDVEPPSGEPIDEGAA